MTIEALREKLMAGEALQDLEGSQFELMATSGEPGDEEHWVLCGPDCDWHTKASVVWEEVATGRMKLVGAIAWP